MTHPPLLLTFALQLQRYPAVLGARAVVGPYVALCHLEGHLRGGGLQEVQDAVDQPRVEQVALGEWQGRERVSCVSLYSIVLPFTPRAN